MGLLVTFILGIFILIGVFVIKLSKNKKIVEQLSISIALGTMTSIVCTELIPEVFETFKTDRFINTILIVLIFTFLGIIILKILDKFIPDHDDVHSLDHNCSNENLIHIGVVSSLAIVLHNIIEGMAVYSITSESLKLGILVALGVGLHNIPMGMIISSTLNSSKKDNKKNIFILSAVTISTFIGGILMMLINNILNEFVIGILICITLGMLIYIIIFELIPHLMHSKNKLLSIFGIIIGILIIVISGMFE